MDLRQSWEDHVDQRIIWATYSRITRSLVCNVTAGTPGQAAKQVMTNVNCSGLIILHKASRISPGKPDVSRAIWYWDYSETLTRALEIRSADGIFYNLFIMAGCSQLTFADTFFESASLSQVQIGALHCCFRGAFPFMRWQAYWYTPLLLNMPLRQSKFAVCKVQWCCSTLH